MIVLQENPPLSLYIHYPWCVRKCPYCDFNSHENRHNIGEQAYIDAVLADLATQLPEIWGRPLESVFIGGGTPSLLSPDGMNQLLSSLRALIQLSPMAEVTMEANPGTAEYGRFAAYREAGINRLSIGVQSFDDDKLQALGRIHSGREAITAVEAAHQAGFERINLDLMFALPGQDLAQARGDLQQAIALAPGHLSYYQLTIEPNTAFAHQPPPLPEDELAWSIHRQGLEQLAAAGFERYEVSAFAREGQRCQHNLNYWQFGDYLAIGAGAHGKISHAARGQILRFWNQRNPRDYLQGPYRAGERLLQPQELGFEFMLNALRLPGGVEQSLFERRTGLPLDHIAGPLHRAEESNLLCLDRGGITPTLRGFDFLNETLQLFLDIDCEEECP